LVFDHRQLVSVERFSRSGKEVISSADIFISFTLAKFLKV